MGAVGDDVNHELSSLESDRERVPSSCSRSKKGENEVGCLAGVVGGLAGPSGWPSLPPPFFPFSFFFVEKEKKRDKRENIRVFISKIILFDYGTFMHFPELTY